MDPVGLIFLYPIGLLVLWIKNKRQKSFREIVQSYEYYEIRGEGVVLILNLVAGTGFIGIVCILIVVMGWIISDVYEALVDKL